MDETPRPGEATPDDYDADVTTGTPRWVKVFAAIALALIVLLVVLLVTGRGGGHGPGRHALTGDGADRTRAPAEIQRPQA